MVAVEGLAGVIRGVVFCERFDDVELDEWVLGEAVEGEVGVAGGVVFRCVVDDTMWRSADVSLAFQGRKNEQIWASFVAFASDEVASRTELPVESETAGSKALVCVVRGRFSIAPVLNLELLALGHSEESENGNKNGLHGEHLGIAMQDDERKFLDGVPVLLLILLIMQQTLQCATAGE